MDTRLNRLEQRDAFYTTICQALWAIRRDHLIASARDRNLS
ncbi:hypothetical protein RBSWK_03260 [Rhodopirellula baltica SWK14]|uniref:Uncharacterized protein n=1 Tax=Rhodopirellula baltica SWK14 TaxID=993516 RepID=L7CFJ9_RHOBT|nr:hypothetical protein RBSWK_03260 [Rhodopirellula baltica SWK14]